MAEKKNNPFGEPKFSFNSVREFIKQTGRSPQELLIGGLSPGDLEVGLALIWAGMLWQNKDLTVEEVEKMLDENPESYLDAANRAGKAVLPAFRRIFNLEEAEEAEKDKGDKIKN